MRKINILLFLLVVVCSLKAQYAGYSLINDPASFKEKFSLAAQKNQSIKSDFVQEKSLSMLSEKVVSKGKFWFKKDMVRLEYTHPYQYLMIMNRGNIFIKDGQKENKISVNSNKIFKQVNKITVDCVQGTVLSNTDFRTRIFEGKNSYMIELTPVAKGIKDLYKTINVIVDKKELSVMSIEMHEISGDNTSLHFLNKELNTNIPDAIFSIK